MPLNWKKKLKILKNNMEKDQLPVETAVVKTGKKKGNKAQSSQSIMLGMRRAVLTAQASFLSHITHNTSGMSC